MEEDKKPENWSEIIKNYTELQKMHDESKEKLTTEILKDNDKKDERKNKIIFGLIAVIAVLAAGLIGSNVYWVYQWNSYDYISQDGEGYNYYNEDVEGDILNGSTNQEKEK